MAFPSPPAASVKILEVHAAIGDLNYAIDELTNNIHLLTQRLSAVTRATNTGDCDNSERRTSDVPLTNTINAQTDRVANLSDQVVDIVSRLEV